MHRDLSKLTVVELREKCKRRKIKGCSKMTKDKMISVLHKHMAMKMKKPVSKKVKKTKRRSMKGGELKINSVNVNKNNNGNFKVTLMMSNGTIKELKGKLGEQIEGYEANGPITNITEQEITYQLPLGNTEKKSLINFFKLEVDNVQTNEDNVQTTEDMVEEINSLTDNQFKQLEEAFKRAKENRNKKLPNNKLPNKKPRNNSKLPNNQPRNNNSKPLNKNNSKPPNNNNNNSKSLK